MMTSYQNGQLGIFAMSFVYLGAWLLGFYNNWIRGNIMACGKKGHGGKRKTGGGRKRK